MCGFAGYWNPSADQPLEQMLRIGNRMASTLVHRGPDDRGDWGDPAAGLVLSHCRLAIRDTSTAGHQPMSSADGRYVVAFNGEIYNFEALRDELSARGHAFRSRSDTEVLLAAVTEWGFAGALQHFVGMYAIALWDCSRRELHLARDRVGEKPLYFGWCGNELVFGSELKALREHPGWSAAIDRRALGHFLRYNYVPAPLSIYEGIGKLPPGSRVTFRIGDAPGSARPIHYWSLGQQAERGAREPFAGSLSEAADQLDELLGQAVGLQMEADVPVGAFLSGGVDSSLIVALMQAAGSRPVRTYTIGFEEREFDESVYARGVAAHLGTEHTELRLSPQETLDTIPELAAIYDEPFADSSQIPTFLVSRLARRDVKVSLSGDGGDEFFGGYERYSRVPRLWERISRIPPGLRRGAGRGLAAAGIRVSHFAMAAHAGGRMERLGQLLSRADEQELYDAFVSRWDAPEEVVIGGTFLREKAELPNLGGGATLGARMMALDAATYLPDDLLVKIDRAAMAVGLETRAPMLDHRVIEFALGLPLSMKVGGRGKVVLRALLDRYVPRELTDRPKMGFMVPVARWLRGPLREWGEELLDEGRLRREGYFNPEPIREKWREHLAGTRDWQYQLWCVLMFQAWLEQSR